MNFNYPKNEKLKSKNTIDLLFSEGKSVSKYPLRLVFVENSNEEKELIKMGVSVSKKYFKPSLGNWRTLGFQLNIGNMKKQHKLMLLLFILINGFIRE